MRFPLLVVEKVRAAVGRSFPHRYPDLRLRADARRLRPETGIEIAKALDGKVDLIHVSAGTQQDGVLRGAHAPRRLPEARGELRPGRRDQKTCENPVVTVGAFSEPDKMEAFLEESGVDCIAMGRALIADPFLPRKIMRGRVEDITPCLRCGECQAA